MSGAAPGEVPAELWRAYEAAWIEVEIDGARFVFPPVARGTPPAIPSDLLPAGFVVTACNPRSERRTAVENRARQDELAAEIDRRGWTRYDAVGHDGGTWREPSFALVDPPRDEVLELARRFAQNAVYEWGSGVWRVVAVPVAGAEAESAE